LTRSLPNAGRLTILTELAVEERQEFVDLRRRTRLTDGNLAAHARRLQSAGLIDIDKQSRGGKPVTTYLLTAEGARPWSPTRASSSPRSRRGASRPAGAGKPPGPRRRLRPNLRCNDEEWVD
jgi:DNA-binding transcriptional ArsR family regulator